MSSSLKAPEKTCQGCEAIIPAQPSGPGRPKVFCSVTCRRRHHHALEQAAIERERNEAEEGRKRALDEHFYGKRKAAQLAKWRAQNRERPWAS
jgi:hypothetical protein